LPTSSVDPSGLYGWVPGMEYPTFPEPVEESLREFGEIMYEIPGELIAPGDQEYRDYYWCLTKCMLVPFLLGPGDEILIGIGGVLVYKWVTRLFPVVKRVGQWVWSPVAGAWRWVVQTVTMWAPRLVLVVTGLGSIIATAGAIYCTHKCNREVFG